MDGEKKITSIYPEKKPIVVKKKVNVPLLKSNILSKKDFKIAKDAFAYVSKRKWQSALKLSRKARDKTLYNLITSESEGIKDFQENFINKRNQNWISVIEESINIEPTFIAVGAGHLYGEKGVINLLKEEGYEVIPVFE